MRLIDQSFTIEECPCGEDVLRRIEDAGRTCYKSEDRITEDSSVEFVRRIIKSGHHSVLEHVNVTVRIVTNRGVTHELVRHRLAAYSQESTRYCNYGGEDVAFVRPVWMANLEEYGEHNYPYDHWTFLQHLESAESTYKTLLANGWSPQQAREVLPNALKTEIVVTANIREWRHIFKLRCSKAAHPQMRALMLIGLVEMSTTIPVAFEDLEEEYLCER